MKEQKGNTEKQKSLSTEQTTKHTQSSASAPHNEAAPGGGKQSFVSLPKGGGAIRGMGEKFEANPVTGTGSFSVPLTISPGRGNFTPQLALAYDSGSGNSPFGLGWNVGMPAITRKTDKGIPQYFDRKYNGKNLNHLPGTLKYGVVAFYPFCGNASDESGNGHNGVVSGATLTTDRFGRSNSAYQFDGNNDYITIADHAGLKPKQITISVWVKQNSYSGTKTGGNTVASYILFKKNSQSSYFEGYTLLSHSGVSKYTGAATNSSNQKAVYGNNIIMNQWIHLVLTINSSELKLYENGILKQTVATGFELDYDNTPLYIGSTQDNFNGYFNGAIDDIIIYNRVLSDNEVSQLHGLDSTYYRNLTANDFELITDSEESDTFILSGAEDLVPVYKTENGISKQDFYYDGSCIVYPYRPRTEGLFALIERHYNYITGISHWRSISKENITTVYGSSSGTRICDPDDETKIFSWLIEKSWDAKGNLMQFEYKKEDNINVNNEIYEHNRLSSQKCFNNLYLKQVKYGNTVMHQDSDWHFYLVFDYGDHSANNLIPDQDWACRPDSYSSFRAGFEIRTYRLCKRVMMFHKFVNDLGSSPVLVKSTDLEYLQNEYLTLLQSVKHNSYNNNDTAGMPPLTFNYSEAIMGSIRNVSKECLQKLPSGIDGSNYQWADLYSEGISGILRQDNHAWYFIPNYGDKTYYEATPMGVNPEPELVLGDVKSEIQKPAAIRNKKSTYHLGDVDSDGLPELIINAPGINGYYSRDDHQKWEAFKTFAHTPNIILGDSNVKLVDLTGDGLADIIISKGSHFEIYFSEGKDGYSNYRRVVCGTNEEKGPVVVFSDAAHRIFLSDMSGDGMVDIVKISNGSISYWPNMGYGHFGEMVSMKNAPHFDRPDLFNPSQLRLADVDGTGSTDIIYLGSSGTKYFKNKAGNGWSDAVDIPYFPLTAKSSNTEVADLFGNGTGCLLWNTALPGKVQRMQYIELTSGIKPYLLTQIDNGMGGLTEMQYAPSTKFYLRDKLSGKPWITRLPFAVHVLERVIITDKVAGNVFVNSYAYHHGYYDNAEREFRGFGMVEQWDTEQYDAMEAAGYNLENENINQESHVPPVYTKTWFHTGFFKNRAEISSHYLSEYFNGDNQAWLLPDTVLPDGLTALESREACRALRGTALRKEIYAKDGTASENIPYTVEEKSYNIRLLQQKGNNKYAVFHVTECETIAYHYERIVDDPRIAHSMVLQTDEYGNMLKSAQIAYPRRTVPQDMPEQGELHIVYNENDFINKTLSNTRLIGVNYQTRAYEITGIAYNNTKFDTAALLTAINNASEIDFSALPSGGVQKRKIQHDRIYFWDKYLSSPLSLGDLTPQALLYQKQSLELTQDLIDLLNNQGTKITSQILTDEGVYLNENDLWWVVSDIQSFNNGAFYQPYMITDPFGNTTTLEYDSYQLLITSITDALYNTTYVANNYRLLQPYQITDPNQNMQMVEFDTLGMVAKMVLAGKNGEGDSQNDPTILYEYDLHNWINNLLPVYSHVSSRETHQDANTLWLESYTYTSGLGQEIQTKVQAEDGLAWIIGANGKEQVNSSNRWTATGRTILNNKGKVVKQYEPWFSNTYGYEPETELTQYGVSPVMHYDPLLRNIRTDFPDGSFAKTEFTPWEQKSYDQIDTVADSQWYADRNSPDPNSPEPNDSNERAAWLSAKHYDTPQTQYFDSLGRVFIIEDDNGIDVNSNPLKYRVHNKLDISGRPIIVTDAKSREMTRHVYGFKQQLFTHNIDSGSRWMITDVAGKPLRNWDDREHAFRSTYDELQRPLNIYLTQNNVEILTEQKVYGTDYNRNNIGQLEYIYDQSGLTQIYEYDFKGNPLQSIKQYCEDYQNDIDWSQSPTLISESFTQLTQYDALNRPILLTQPDNSLIAYSYNKAALLETVTVNGNPYVTNINYNEKGQRTDIYYGNNSKTKYEYDSFSFRLTRLLTTRNTGQDILQDIYYTYDAVGNIVEQTDLAQQTHYFNNSVIEPKGKYQYDALYRLIQAVGRELSYLNMPDNNDFANNIPVPSDADMQNYTQHYTYDEIGNILELQNTGGSSWTRYYNYDFNTNNYLLSNNEGSFTYDEHGNMISMPHLSGIKWDFADRLRQASNGTFTSYYNYNSSGERSRKVVEKGNIREERYYIGGYEVFRKYVNGSLDTERQTLHVDDDNKKVALVDTLTIENGTPCSPGVAEVRYQYDNHLGSACLELDEYADIISYEEYHPFGTTSYRSGRTETEVSLKRYKYVGKERDEETGLYYYGARYYAAWLCRFVSVDPLQHEYPDLTPYQYASNSPVSYIDLDGLEKANTAFNINDMLNQAAKRFAPVQDNIKPNTPSSVKKMEVEAQKAEKAKKKEEYQNTTQYKENAKSIQQASANALFPNGTPLAFDITNKTLSHTSTAVSTFQVITQQMNKSFIMGNNGMLFKKIADPRLAFVQGQVLKEGKLKLLDGKMVKMTNDIENLNKNFGTLDNIGISINAASSVFVGLETYNKTGKMEEAMGAGAINFALNWNPTVSVIYTFGSAVANTDEFKQQMFKYWESKMNEYRNTDLKLYNNAANNYNKYYNELGIIKEPINAQIKQAD